MERVERYSIFAVLYYKDYPTAGVEKTPVAAFLADHVLTLPMYADLTLEDIDRICAIILGCGK